MTLRLPASTPRATRSAAAEVAGEDRAGQAVLRVVGERDRVAPRRRRASPPRPGRTPPRARPARRVDVGSTTRRRQPEAVAVRASTRERDVDLVEVALHGVALARPRPSVPSRWPRRAGSSDPHAPAPPSRAGRRTRRTPTARPGSASARSSPGRRCRRRRTARVAAAAATSASAKTMLALLPPSSRVTRFTCSAQPAMICLPTSVEPVKQTLRTSGWVTNRSPTTEPLPGMHGEHALGQPGLERQLADPDRGQRGDLGRLEHDRVAGRQRGREAPAGDRHREVPRHDHADDAERLVEGDVDAAGDRDLPAEEPLRAPPE